MTLSDEEAINSIDIAIALDKANKAAGVAKKSDEDDEGPWMRELRSWAFINLDLPFAAFDDMMPEDLGYLIEEWNKKVDRENKANRRAARG